MSFRFPDLLVGWIVATAIGAGMGSPTGPSLRICADPDNVPFSNQQGEGFENRIAEVLARDLRLEPVYVWREQRRGFVRKGIGTGACDVVMGVPANLAQLERTAPYYRSSYMFVTRRDRAIALHGIEDSALRTLTVGVQLIGDDGADTPPAAALARLGIIRNVKGFVVPDPEAGEQAPRIIRAVIGREVDVALVWGPLAGYWAKHSPTPLVLTPVEPSAAFPYLPFEFDIAVGVRKGDIALTARLDSALTHRRAEVARILTEFGVPAIALRRTVAP
jgi:quinoprotein dehydrogenase-associated probable ABC transporter substrate-binding protein